MSLVKTKSFPMPPINVDEAVMCLDYIGHDCEIFTFRFVMCQRRLAEAVSVALFRLFCLFLLCVFWCKIVLLFLVALHKLLVFLRGQRV